MANLNWYLKSPDKKGRRLIFTIVKYSKAPEGLKYYTGITIGKDAKWKGTNSSLIKMKSGPDEEVDDKLDKFKEVFKAAFKDEDRNLRF